MKDRLVRLIIALGLFVFGVLNAPAYAFSYHGYEIPTSLLQDGELAEDNAYPVLIGRDGIYADIDTVNRVLYVMVRNELWDYNLNAGQWTQRHVFEQEEMDRLFQDPKEFGYDHVTGNIYFWSTGVGLVFELDLKTHSLERIDRSFDHKNQFGHVPFFYNGMIHAFGGYGYWQDKNLITYYLPNLREWKILTPAKGSDYPPEIVGAKGIYVEEEQAFFIYGGSYIQNRGHDDGNSNRVANQSLWKFDFETMLWSREMTIDLTDGKIPQAFGAFNENGIGRSSVSASAYSRQTGNWYLPVQTSEGNRPAISIKTIGLTQMQNYELFELEQTIEAEVITTNFLFDQKSQELILLGFQNITNDNAHPIVVLKIPEQDLISKLTPVNDNSILLFGSLVGIGLLLILGFVVMRYRGSVPGINGRTPTVQIEELMADLNKTEKLLLKTIMDADQMPETSDLEEMVWPEVDNYDYRRKLRNETIRSINKKTQDAFGVNEKLIIRQRDTEDSRRFRYGINDELLNIEY